MANRSLRHSRIGLWIASAGGILSLICLAVFAVLIFWPALLAGQEWLIGMRMVIMLALALIVIGGWVWGTGRTAEGIADWSEKAEARGVHPLVTLAVAVAFGAVMILPWVWRAIKDFLAQPGALEREGAGFELMVLGAPALLFVAASLILVKHRAKRPGSLEEKRAQQRGEKRHSVMLMMATPFVILVPYFIWVSMQPAPEIFDPSSPHRGVLAKP